MVVYCDIWWRVYHFIGSYKDSGRTQNDRGVRIEREQMRPHHETHILLKHGHVYCFSISLVGSLIMLKQRKLI